MQKSKLKNYLELHLIVFIWGFTAVLGALIKIDAIPLVWYRMFISTLFILGYLLVTKKSFKVDAKGLFRFFITGTIIALHWVAFFYAIKVSNVSVTLVMLSTGALFTSLIEPLFFRRKINVLEILFGLITVLGISIIFKVEGSYLKGMIFALIAAFLSALFSVLTSLSVRKYQPYTISFYQMFFGVAFITAYIFFTEGFVSEKYTLVTNDVIYLLVLAGICTAYPFIASVRLMKYITPYTMLLTINLEPVYGIILAVLVFGEKEQMSPQFYIGTFIIFVTVIIEAFIKNRKEARG